MHFVSLWKVRWLSSLALLGAFWAQPCRVATLSDVQFNYIRLEVASLSMEASRLERINEIVAQNCLSAAQLKDLLWLLDHESTRLEVIRKGADRVYNSHVLAEELKELFTTESGQRAFEKWLREWQRKKRTD